MVNSNIVNVANHFNVKMIAGYHFSFGQTI
ncbi:hypothetical protein O185_17890 [Photorhabdus temperata J3]|uniref:Uncharacterized protein n=1 Tax=Photorhabdus temperata J3 TaxID=1389415 RepID=U7QWQ5_PHOTE|nr:hypothetical protein O185_17890 [Photorhabdus temperata J3]